MLKMMVLLLSCIIGCSALGHERMIVVRGAGEIEAIPDLIRISIGIVEQDRRSLARAKSRLDERSSEAAAALIENGVREEDIFSPSMRLYEDEYSIPVTHATWRMWRAGR